MNCNRPTQRLSRTPQTRASSGFTLIELSVVLAAMGTLMAFLLPALLQAREAARRVQCQNNLKQLGIAMHDFHDTHGAFPPGWSSIEMSDDGSVLRPADLGCLWAWGAYLLPQLDQAALHDHLGVLGVTDPPSPGETLDVGLNVFTCPSDAGGRESGWGLYRWESSNDEPTANLVKGYAKSNYAAVNGKGISPFQAIYAAEEFPSADAGIFGNETRTRFQDIRDGASQTLAVGEREMSRADRRTRPRGAVWIRNVGQLISGTGDWFAAQKSQSSLKASTAADDSFTVFLSIHCDANSVVGVTSEHIPLNRTSYGFSSLHPGGAYFLFADGSVRFLNDSIDGATYANLGAMADGQIVSDF